VEDVAARALFPPKKGKRERVISADSYAPGIRLSPQKEKGRFSQFSLVNVAETSQPESAGGRGERRNAFPPSLLATCEGCEPRLGKGVALALL